MIDPTADTQMMPAVRPTDRPSFAFAPGSNVHDSDTDIPPEERHQPPPPIDRVSVPVGLIDSLVSELHHARLSRERDAARERETADTNLLVLALQEQVSRANSGITALLFQGKPIKPVEGIELLGMRLLLVEDFAPLAHAVDEALERFGAKVTLRAGYIDAIGWLLEPRELDIAVLDIRLGDGDGITLAKRIRDEYPRCAIVLTTGALTDDYRKQAKSHRVGLLAKPHSPEQLLEAILDEMDAVRA